MADDHADARRPLRDKLPMVLPRPCPICGAKVYLTGVIGWSADDGEILEVEYDCETEPDIDSPEWTGWQHGHWSHPYMDWLPWEAGMMAWLNREYHYCDETA